MMDKQARIEKRIKKRESDKRHKKLPWKIQELLDSKVVLETNYNGFPLELLELKNGWFKVVSPFFKKGCSSNPRKTKSAALNQGYYLVYTLVNYDDERELFLSEEGWEFLNNNKDLKIQHPALRKIEID